MPGQGKVGRILVRAGLVDLRDIAQAWVEAARGEGSLVDMLVRRGRLTEEQVAKALAGHYRLPFVHLAATTFDPAAVALLKETEAWRGRAIPVRLESDGTVMLAVADPADCAARQAIEFQSRRVQVVVATPSAISDAIETHYRAHESLDQVVKEIREPEGLEVIGAPATSGNGARGDGVLDLRKHESQPVVKTANVILRDAVEKRASDVHIEPGTAFLRVRFRIDGVLEEALRLPMWIQPLLAARLKVLAGLDVADRRIPQDGRFKIRLGKREVDIRVSTLPTHAGEAVVLRLLDPNHALHSLEALGLGSHALARVREAIHQPQGLILVTGPTGSGKTSTLHAAVRAMVGRPINIVSVENPIEYELPGVKQVQVNEKAGLTFATTLRSILRQDPNVILLGEIRDDETAGIALRAAQTGHLVLSTLHTNDAASAVTRLVDLGVASYIVASSLLLVVAQRLVRRVCGTCRTADRSVEAGTLARLGLGPMTDAARGAGCDECGFTGYRGRIAVTEVLPVDARVRRLLEEPQAESALRTAMKEVNLPMLLDDARDKMMSGLTTADEVMRVIELPAAVPQSKPAAEATASSVPAPRARDPESAPALDLDPTLIQGIKILVVDDDPNMRKLLRLYLRRSRHGVAVRTAANGREALEAIAEDPPSLILLDLMMPEVDGFEVCRQLRGDLKTAFIPILMMTSGPEDQMRAQAFRVGTDDFVGKPVVPADLELRLDRLLERTYGV